YSAGSCVQSSRYEIFPRQTEKDQEADRCPSAATTIIIGSALAPAKGKNRLSALVAPLMGVC
ncbi:MAG: hypothetical protein PVG60_04630, partial [Desulfarculaceae bacterium]